MITRNISKHQRTINILFFLLPLVYLGSGIRFYILRLLIAIILATVLIVSKIRIRKHDFAYLIFIAMYVYFIIRKDRYGAIASIIILYMSYLWFYCEKIPFEIKRITVDRIFQGFLFAGLIGFVYMYLTNQFITGGKYTENDLNISNLTVPLFLSLYVIYGVIRTWYTKKKLKRHVLCYLLLFLIIVFLEKRGPVIFCIISIVFVIRTWSSKLKKYLLIILFLYPFYGQPLTDFIINYYTQTFGLFFKRVDDFESMESNPRIKRLYAAEQFIYDFNYADLFGYHRELILTKEETDIAHNHFHNTFLQLYYERGLISVIILLLLLYKFEPPENKNALTLKINYSVILFLLLIGTNESILKSNSNEELFLILMLLFSKPLNDYEKTL